MASHPEVVILGAGLAGMTAAYHLRDRDVVVIESRDRVGGRTLSGEHDGYWYNAGAWFVWDARTVALGSELGLDVLGGAGALSAVFVNGKLAIAPDPNRLFMKMPVPWVEKARFGLTITRLRRIASRMHGLDADLDAKSLAEVIGPTSDITRDILEMATTSGTGLSTDEVSGAVGLGYAIHLFGGNVNDTLKSVRGGTQQIAKTISRAIDPERLMLDCKVESVESAPDHVAVRYRRDGGAVEEVEATACIAALPVDSVIATIPGLPASKRAALEEMLPYTRIVSVAWLTDEQESMPWERLLAVPAIGLSFELLSNNAFFGRRSDGVRRRQGGSLVTLSTGPRAEALEAFDDAAVTDKIRSDLLKMFPGTRDILEKATTRVQRWHGLPRFRKGWLERQTTIREPFGRIHFCGDYTAQPGTPGAVGSGYHAAAAVRSLLD